jgi:hypothetical protein
MDIEKNVPFERKKKETKYPFDKMEVGDSFFVECDEFNSSSRRASTMALALYHTKSEKKKFKSALCDGGFRVWRVK